MVKLNTKYIVVAVVFLSFCASIQSEHVWNFENPSRSFSIDSKDYPLSIQLVSSGGSNPTIEVSVKGDESFDVDAYRIVQEGSSLVLERKEQMNSSSFSTEESSSGSAMRQVTLLPLTILLGFCALFISRKQILVFAISILIVISVSNISVSAETLDSAYYKVTIHVPEGWMWDDFQVNGSGMFHMQENYKFQFKQASFDVCGGARNSVVSLTNVFVVDSLTVCADHVAFIGDINNSADLYIEGRSTASFDLREGEFDGQIFLSSSDISISGGEYCVWEESSNFVSGTCGSRSARIEVQGYSISVRLPHVESSTSNSPVIEPSKVPVASEAPVPSSVPSVEVSYVPVQSNEPQQSFEVSPSNPVIPANLVPSVSPVPAPSNAPNEYYEPIGGPYYGQVVCPIGFRDPMPSGAAPASDPVLSYWTNPGTSHELDSASDWNVFGQGPPTTLSAFDSITINVHNNQYASAVFYISTIPEVTLASGASHTFSLKMWQEASNSFAGFGGTLSSAPLDVSLIIVGNLPSNSGTWFSTLDDGVCSACNVIHYEQLIISSPIPTSAASASVTSTTFTPSYDGGAIVVLMVRQPGTSGAANGNDFYFRNVELASASVNRVFPAPIAQSSPFVDVPKQPLVGIPSQTNCPHSRNDLVDWHDPSIWPGNIVPSGIGYDNIVIPSGKSVLISSCSLNPSGRYNTIYVPTGTELIFADADIQMEVGNIHVNGGHLWIGSESCRILSNVQITLHKDAYTLPEPYGKKGITSSGTGVIDMHGKLFQPTWTRLAASAVPGDDRILLMDSTNWEVGQQVVIATSIWEDHLNPQNEVLTISAIQYGKRVQFTERLKFYHHAGPEYQSEVGLLSRKILIQGDSFSETISPPTGTIGGFGGHILSNGDIARFSGVQTYRMGQTNTLAKYPFHFHMMGESANSYFTDCSVYHSYYRCFTVHGTNSTSIHNNVAYDVQGHCFYIEDGVEEKNSFRFNLAVYPQALVEITNWNSGGQGGVTIYQNAQLSVPADAAVSGFYISNANNEFYGNAASGGWTGFSFINFPAPIGSHSSWTWMVPQERPLAKFYGNTAHSASYQWDLGACIYTGGSQKTVNGQLEYNVGRKARNTKDNQGNPVWMQFEQTRTYLCNLGLNHWGDRVEALGLAAHDITKGAALFGEAYLHEIVIDGHSSNPLGSRPSPTRAFEFYDTFVKTILDGVVIKNLEETPLLDEQFGTYGIVSMTHSDYFKPQGISASRGIVFENVWSNGKFGNKIRDTGASRFYNVMDYDGSMLNTGVKTIIGSANVQEYGSGSNPTQIIKEWWNVHPDMNSQCTLHPEYTLYSCPKGNNQEIASLLFDVNQLTNNVNTWPVSRPGMYGNNEKRVGTVSQFGYTGNSRRSTIMTNNPGVTGITGDRGWYTFFDAGTPQEIFLRVSQVPVIDGNPTHVIVAMKFPSYAKFDIETKTTFNPVVTTRVNRANSFSEMYYDGAGLKYYSKPAANNQMWLFLKIVFNYNSPDDGYFERNGIRLYDVTNFYSYRIASCYSENNCPTYTGAVPVWEYLTDEVPPTVSQLLV